MFASVTARIRIGLVEPVDLGILDRDAIAHRHMDHDIRHELGQVSGRPIVPAGFEQQYLGVPVGAQAVGQHTPCRPATNDDVVGVDFLRHLHS